MLLRFWGTLPALLRNSWSDFLEFDCESTPHTYCAFMNPRCLGLALPALLLTAQFAGAAAELDTARIESITGLKGSLHGQVFKVTRARTDVPVRVDAWTMPPFMGLTSWAAFTPGTNADAMVMGDLVLFEDEVNPVMSAAFAAGLSITALHNHFFFDDPRVFFMHIGGEGSVEQLAGGVKAAFAQQDAVRAAHPQPTRVFGSGFAPAENAITPTTIEQILGVSAQTQAGMCKVVFGRETHMPDGSAMGAAMGVNTWAAFAGTDDNAVVDGDFAVREEELQTVLRALRAVDFNIVAIHHHMTHEEPRILFLHYWAKGDSSVLARGLKSALDAQRAVGPMQ